MSWDLILWRGRPLEPPLEVWERLYAEQPVKFVAALRFDELVTAFRAEYGDGVRVEPTELRVEGQGFEWSAADGDRYVHVTCAWGFASDGDRLSRLIRAGRRGGCSALDVQSGTFWEAPLPGEDVEVDPLDASDGEDDAEEVVVAEPLAPPARPVAERGSGAGLVVRVGARTCTLTASARWDLEDVLRRSGRLDEDLAAPDLTRWTERALRRAGLAAAPPSGSEAERGFREIWLGLTARDRAVRGRKGAVPRFCLTEPGAWPLGPADLAVLCGTPGVDRALVALLDGAHQAEVEVG